MSISDAEIQSAAALLMQGKRPEALVRLEALLAAAPQHPIVLFLLGTAEVDDNRLEAAATHLQAAVDLAPQHVGAWINLGLTQQKRGQVEAAEDAYAHAVGLEASNALAHFRLANILKLRGRLAEAEAGYRRAIALKPDYVEALINLGNVQMMSKQLQAALSSYDRVLAVNPNIAIAHNNRGNLLMSLQRHEEALADFDRAIALKPDFVEAYSNRGNALREIALAYADGKLVAPEKDAAVANDAAGANDAFDTRSNVRKNRVLLEAARDNCSMALRLNPRFLDATINRGNALHQLNALPEALADFDCVLAQLPQHAIARNGRSNVLREMGRLDEALQDLDIAVARNPAYAEAWNNRGNVLKALLRLDEARDSFTRALALDANNASIPWNLALLELLEGRFAEGWRLYEKRWQRKVFRKYLRDWDSPLWLGETPVSGKTVLVHTEQGFGDVLQFCRYAPLLRQRGARVVLEVNAPLLALVESLAPDIVYLPAGAPLPAHDLHIPIMSLPLAFATTPATIPAAVPYLHPDQAKRAGWRRKLGPKTAPRIGLVMSGKPEHTDDHNRSIPLATLEPLLALPLEFHCLQNVIRDADADVGARHANLQAHTADLIDFSDTAALAAEMDCIVSVDTSVAHLAGALGLPVYILLPFSPDWRWGLQTAATPWYPTATLLRQPRRGDWQSVVQILCERLAKPAPSSEKELD